MIIGDQRPRIFHAPRGIVSSLGQESNELASVAGLDLDDWESWYLDQMVSKNDAGKWAAFEAGLIVSRQNGKGSILEARELAGLFLINSDRLILHTAHEHKTAKEHYERVFFLIDNCPELSKRVARYSSAYGREFIQTKALPTIIIGSSGRLFTRNVSHRLLFIARSAGSGRGFTGDLLVFDEAMILESGRVGSSLPALSARPNPQVVYAASAGKKTSTQLASVRRRGINGTSPSLLFAEWSIDPHDEYCDPSCTRHDDPDDVSSLARANPGLGIRISLDHIEKEREAMDWAEFARERLGVGEYPAPLDGWLVIPERWWKATRATEDELPRPGLPVFALDIAPDRSSATIALAGIRPDGLVAIEIVDRQSGTGWLLPRLIELNRKWRPRKFVLDKRAAAGSLIVDLERQGLAVETLAAGDVAHACGQIFDAFRDDMLRHDSDPAFRDALAGADKRPLSESWAFDRRNTAVDLSPLMAGTFAYWGYLKFGARAGYDARKSVHFDLAEIKRLYSHGAYGPPDLQRLIDRNLLSEQDLAYVTGS